MLERHHHKHSKAHQCQSPPTPLLESCKDEGRFARSGKDIGLRNEYPVSVELAAIVMVILAVDGDSMLGANAGNIPRHRITHCFIYGVNLGFSLVLPFVSVA
jgi:hypothetical protein